LVNQLVQGFSQKYFALKFTLIVLGFALCVLALANLVLPTGEQKVNRNGIDVMIALDVSNSMLADDIKPSRLERAKQIISKLIDRLGDDRIGIVIFAGRAYLQMPMTTDHSAAKMYLSAASPSDVPTQGTVISEALKMCYSAFNTKEKKYRTIILITDGEDHDEDAIKVTKELSEEGVMVNTIGIGSPQGSPIRDAETPGGYKKDENGNMVITKLNEEELRTIAQTGNGLYQLFTSADVVAGNMNKKLAGMGQTSLVDSSFAINESYFWYFLLGALILLVAELFFPERKKIKTNRVITKSTVTLLLLLVINNSFAQSGTKAIIKGNEAYKIKQYDNAVGQYQKALAREPANAIASFNLGNALYRKNKTDDALKSYESSVKNTKDNNTKEKIYYNSGVTLQKQNKLPECITAYKNALKLLPTDEDARQNLERALKQQKQQQKSADQNNNKSQKNDQDKKQKQNEDPKPQPSKISQQDADEKLKSLLEHEKELQDKLKKVRVAAPDKPKKDW
nr:VWA domain-containing protein [Chitinophagaceae bacterium]